MQNHRLYFVTFRPNYIPIYRNSKNLFKSHFMKKIVLTSVIVIIASVIGFSQSLDEVLAKHYKAVGTEKLSKVNTFIIKAKINQMGMDLPMEMKIKRPGKFRMEMEMQGQKMIQASNGEVGWMIAPWVSSAVQDLTGEQLKQAQAQTDLDGELYNYKEKGNTVELIGKVKVDDKDAYRIKLTGADEQVRNYFIDANTYLILKVKAKVTAMGQTVDVEQRMVDYKTFDGIKMATKMESDSPMGTTTILLEDVQLNPEIDDAIFEKPAK